jgi:adenine-specific DNA-methyltransferase
VSKFRVGRGQRKDAVRTTSKKSHDRKRASKLRLGVAKLTKGDALEKVRALPKEHYSLIISSPPYNIGKIYERKKRLTIEDYKAWQEELAAELVKKLKRNGSLCWQVGNYIKNGQVYPLDMLFYEIFSQNGLKLRNRIIWKFNFGHNADRRFSGRYETVLWFTKSDNYQFNLDAVRIPQLYPGKRHSKAKGSKAGLPSGNPKGKNPADYWEFSALNDFSLNPIWDIPNVKANHPEKTSHPCQFPIELAERCILAFTNKGDSVLDPFVGTGASVIAAVKNQRNGTGIDKERRFLRLAEERLSLLRKGELEIRPLGRPVRRPIRTEKVSRVPEEWTTDKKRRKRTATRRKK